MIKKGFQIIGLLSLFIFSFFYTDKVVTVVKNQDPIMIKINAYEDVYNIEPIDAIIDNNMIIPGVNGCVVNINKSYSNMKRIGNYNPNMIEYKEMRPKLSLNNIYDKYIIKGNITKNEIALVFKVNTIDNLKEIEKLLNEKQVKASFFIDGKDIEEKTIQIYETINAGHEIYNLGYDKKYEKDLLIWTNNIIERIANNMPSYCLLLNENQSALELCAQNRMYTIKSELVINYSNSFNTIMNKVEKGSIIVFDVNNNTKNELLGAITYLSKRGYSYNLLSKHLSEKGC